MSRSDYREDCDDMWALIRWRGAVAAATRGRRGQAMLKELLHALDALPEKRLAADSLVSADGDYCALGALGRLRNIDLESIDPYEHEAVAGAFGIAEALAREVMYMNDEWVRKTKCVTVEICGPMRLGWPDYGKHTRQVVVDDERAAEKRWNHVRDWVASQIQETTE